MQLINRYKINFKPLFFPSHSFYYPHKKIISKTITEIFSFGCIMYIKVYEKEACMKKVISTLVLVLVVFFSFSTAWAQDPFLENMMIYAAQKALRGVNSYVSHIAHLSLLNTPGMQTGKNSDSIQVWGGIKKIQGDIDVVKSNVSIKHIGIDYIREFDPASILLSAIYTEYAKFDHKLDFGVGNITITSKGDKKDIGGGLRLTGKVDIYRDFQIQTNNIAHVSYFTSLPYKWGFGFVSENTIGWNGEIVGIKVTPRGGIGWKNIANRVKNTYTVAGIGIAREFQLGKLKLQAWSDAMIRNSKGKDQFEVLMLQKEIFTMPGGEEFSFYTTKKRTIEVTANTFQIAGGITGKYKDFSLSIECNILKSKDFSNKGLTASIKYTF